jgi:hypothetical protein
LGKQGAELLPDWPLPDVWWECRHEKSSFH